MPSGVEAAGQSAAPAHNTLRKDFRATTSRHARVVLVDAAPQVLPPFGAKLGEKAQRELEKLGVEVILGAMVTEVDRAHADGDTLGGVVEVVGYGLPPGLGSHVHWDRRLDARLAGGVVGV